MIPVTNPRPDTGPSPSHEPLAKKIRFDTCPGTNTPYKLPLRPCIKNTLPMPPPLPSPFLPISETGPATPPEIESAICRVISLSTSPIEWEILPRSYKRTVRYEMPLHEDPSLNYFIQSTRNALNAHITGLAMAQSGAIEDTNEA